MFKIVWTLEAEERYLEVLQFWIDHNKSAYYSGKIIKEVEKKERLLAHHPLIGVVVETPHATLRKVLVLDNFSIYYRINDHTVEVVSFWANKMNPTDLIEG